MHFDIQNYIVVSISFKKAVSNFPHMKTLDNLLVHEKMSFVGLSLARTMPTDRLKVKMGASLLALILVCSEGLLL